MFEVVENSPRGLACLRDGMIHSLPLFACKLSLPGSVNTYQRWQLHKVLQLMMTDGTQMAKLANFQFIAGKGYSTTAGE